MCLSSTRTNLFSARLGGKGSKIKLLEALNFFRLSYFQWDRCSGTSTVEIFVNECGQVPMQVCDPLTGHCTQIDHWPQKNSKNLRKVARIAKKQLSPVHLRRTHFRKTAWFVFVSSSKNSFLWEYLLLWHQSWTAVHGRAASWLQMAWVIS